MKSIQTTATQRVLCVDMDGTVLATDVLWESLLVLLKTSPFALLFLLPFWICKGKAYLKRELARRVSLNIESLPYRQDVLKFLREEKKSGREIMLTTASDASIAQRVADYLGVFSGVLASDGKVNLSGKRKLEAIRRYTDDSGFDYVGDSKADLCIWQSATQAILVSPSSRLLNRAQASSCVERVFESKGSKRRVFFRALRVHQWVKNFLIFVPLIMAHGVTALNGVWKTIIAFAAFSLCASSVYVLNDLLDLEADRQHPHKRRRPFAAGTLAIPVGVAIVPVLLTCGITIAAVLLPGRFLLELLTYFAITLAYSFWIKRLVVLDVLTLAGLYTIRVLAGGAAASVPISPWMLAFSTFLFLSLAFMKRYSELLMIQERSGVGVQGRDYTVADIGLLRSVGPASGLICVLVLALYVHSDDVAKLYRSPLILWLIGPCMLYWITRLWLLANRGQIEGDPIVFTARDPVSYVVGTVVMIVIVAASLL